MVERVLRHMTAALLAAFVLAACGGPGAAEPTAIPAGVVRPEQPTPAFSTAEPRFRLEDVTAEPRFVATPAPRPTATPGELLSRAELLGAFLMAQPPSAMGIATGGATITSERGGGAVVAAVPAGGTLTVTGRSVDGQWLAVFLEDASAGWVPANALRLFGADDLTVVDEAFSPGPVATLIAEARLPVGTPVAAIIEARSRQAQPASAADEDGTVTGTVISEGRLNLRSLPTAEGEAIAALESGAAVAVLGRTQAGDWLRVRTPAGEGWVNAAFVQVAGESSALPVME